VLTRVLYKFLCSIIGLTSLLILPAAVSAHEFWLEPLSFSIERGDNIQAHIKVGQGLDGDTYGYFPANFERFDLTVKDTTQPLKNRFAQKPAVDQPTTSSGLHIFTYQSRPSKLRYEKRETFEKFLREEGIEWVLKAHEKRGLPSLDFTELFKRFAKSLVKVGEGEGQDRLTGLPFEWVVLDNPYTNSEKKKISAQLFFEDKPFSGSTVNVFIKRDDKVDQIKLETDEKGRIEVPVEDGGLFLVNAVHMVEPSQKVAGSSRAVWMSLWASTTFLID